MTSLAVNICRLAFFGPQKEPATLKMASGLNVLWGSSDTGKSFVIESIDYMLGGRAPPRDIPLRQGYNIVVLNIVLSDGRQFTLQRGIEGGAFLLREGYFDQIDEGNSQKLSPVHASGKLDNLSGWLLDKLGCAATRLKTNARFETRGLSFRDLASLCIVEEERIIARRAPIFDGQVINQTVQRAVLKFLLTGVDDAGLVSLREAKEASASLQGRREAIRSLIEGRRKRAGTLEDVATRRADIEKRNEELQNMVEDVDKLQRQYRDTQRRHRLAIDLSEGLQRRAHEIGGLLQRFDLLERHYNSDIARLQGIVDAGTVFAILENERCPLCGTPAERQDHHSKCDANIEPLIAAAQAENIRVESLKAGLIETRNQLIEEQAILSGRLNRNEHERTLLERRVNEFSTSVRSRRSGFADLVRERDQLARSLLDADIVAGYEADLATVEDGIRGHEALTASSDQGVLPRAATSDFSQQIEDTLIAWDLPGVGRVTWEDPASDVTFGNSSFVLIMEKESARLPLQPIFLC